MLLHESQTLPRFFGKSGPTDTDPRKAKKDGGGKGNWGRSGEEMQDSGYTFANARRHSNSSSQGLVEFQTKFEIRDPDPAFQEQLHGSADALIDGETAVLKTEKAIGKASMTEQHAPHLGSL
ncbi:hypothetical protein N7468_003299 [Penicillium chermesinum]|uniref:Hyaluronan/mRNA-binding protein domain-containing protein n=1 Tax=Penicillium chermesinum TaxID=63820 RepID=A0A9W9P6P4_9EURO|nr:uncharacterized protein N7468_003299 [Penicillium chermesinum]KAJ5238680.1 hypothetical protein N7468_003299 [Penicillium chermesinum]KAJ6164325.1 hypothetical protein N7470_002997 [Penicillium chermesinum]